MTTMKNISNVIDAICHTRGRNDKMAILHNAANVPLLRETLQFIYNPYHKTGISSAKLKMAHQMTPVQHVDVSLIEALKYFRVHTTGSDADVYYAACFIACQEDAATQLLASAIVSQKLTIGVTAKTLNAVFGATFIPITGCMLGTLYSDVGEVKTKWPCIVTEKLDGIRRIMIKENGKCRLFSRSGHEDSGLVDIIRDAAALPNNMVYDGELLAAGTFKDSIAQRQATSSLANANGERSGLIFNVFDMVAIDDFYAGKSDLSESALVRKIRLGATLMDESIQHIDEDWSTRIRAFGIHENLQAIKPVPILGVVDNINDVTPMAASIWARGGEGVMLNTVTGLYEIKRSKSLLKVKHTEDHTLMVIDMIEGDGKYEDAMGAIVVLYINALGIESRVGVGTGFTDEQRFTFWQQRDSIIGQFVEVETFGESTNAAGFTSLNCPVFKRIVGCNA